MAISKQHGGWVQYVNNHLKQNNKIKKPSKLALFVRNFGSWEFPTSDPHSTTTTSSPGRKTADKEMPATKDSPWFES